MELWITSTEAEAKDRNYNHNTLSFLVLIVRKIPLFYSLRSEKFERHDISYLFFLFFSWLAMIDFYRAKYTVREWWYRYGFLLMVGAGVLAGIAGLLYLCYLDVSNFIFFKKKKKLAEHKNSMIETS